MVPPAGSLCVDTQPLAKPSARMFLHDSVGWADRPQTEVVGPAIQPLVERCYQRCRILLGVTPSGHLSDRLTNTLYSLLGRSGAPIGTPRLWRAASTKRIPEKIELFFRQATDPRLTFVHRQLQPRHHGPHRPQCLVGLGTTANHEIIHIINDVRLRGATRSRSESSLSAPTFDLAWSRTHIECRPACARGRGYRPMWLVRSLRS